ncbi:MAG: YggS family pyridoxal phosphate-dependent enzyme [Oscillospiraceae bacterium]|nr:YggS family pyridoxal phosphate-dependent enzyme [Oscillospiraceae bacterium]
MSIAENVARIKEDIAKAALAAGRDPSEILLCAATKMNDADAVREAIRAGVDCCGENRAQELTAKQAQNAYDGVPVHFIGHLQTNKVKQVVGKVSLIQSIDSMHLLEAVDKEAARQGICQDILLEINVGNEESKSGFSTEQIHQILSQMENFSNICVRGLMAIPPICQNSTDNHKFFQEIYHLAVDITAKKYDNVSVDILSMGMSDDYADAIACGSTMIRVGTAIFGARRYS